MNIRKKDPNSLYVEFGGRALLYSINYERFITPKIGVGVGAGAFGVGWAFPAYVSFVPVGNIHSLYLSAGVTPALDLDVEQSASGGFFDRDVDASGTDIAGTLQVAYQLQSWEGLLIRLGMTTFISESGVLPWPTATLGLSF